MQINLMCRNCTILREDVTKYDLLEETQPLFPVEIDVIDCFVSFQYSRMKDKTVAKQLLNGVADVETDGVANGTKTHNDVRSCDGARKRIHSNHSLSVGVVQEHEPIYDDIPTRIQILTDWANICTFLGAILATLAMASMWNRR